MKKIKKCPSCSSYTLRNYCKECDEKTINPKPSKFSPEDKYGEYRRRQKKKS